MRAAAPRVPRRKSRRQLENQVLSFAMAFYRTTGSAEAWMITHDHLMEACSELDEALSESDEDWPPGRKALAEWHKQASRDPHSL